MGWMDSRSRIESWNVRGNFQQETERERMMMPTSAMWWEAKDEMSQEGVWKITRSLTGALLLKTSSIDIMDMRNDNNTREKDE